MLNRMDLVQLLARWKREVRTNEHNQHPYVISQLAGVRWCIEELELLLKKDVVTIPEQLPVPSEPACHLLGPGEATCLPDATGYSGESTP